MAISKDGIATPCGLAMTPYVIHLFASYYSLSTIDRLYTID
ncbi:MAG: hypothetical protein PHU49_14190 [Syntrophorhabdaceae bacterium]|nr:hypothetical protein [Syntrophorhabdaceae bacterium]